MYPYINNPYTRFLMALALTLSLLPDPAELEPEPIHEEDSATLTLFSASQVDDATHHGAITPPPSTEAPPAAATPTPSPSPKPSPTATPKTTPAPASKPSPTPTPVPTLSAAQKAINYATAQLDKPYVYGAAGPNSFDCSGLTMMAWRAAGIRIPRTSQEQWANLPHVKLSNIRPGDLVVYYSGATHIAIYIGNGRIIEAPHTGDIVKRADLYSMPILGVVRPG